MSFIKKNENIKIGRAFKRWTSNQLIRFKSFLAISRFSFIIKNMSFFYFTASKVFGSNMVNKMIEILYGDIFIGGKNEKDLIETIHKLSKNNILTISDYAIEVINDHEEHLIPSNIQKFKDSIDVTISISKENMIAVKLSAFATASYLKSMNELQLLLSIIEKHISSIDINNKNELVKSLLSIDYDIQDKNLNHLITNINCEIIREIYDFFSNNCSENNSNKYKFNLFDLIITNKHNKHKVLLFLDQVFTLNRNVIDFYIEKTYTLNSFADDLFLYSSQKQCHLMVDAEQTYLQCYIDYIMIYFFKKYNTDICRLSTTIQFYLKNSKNVAEGMMKYCKDNKVLFGVKMVRGAYLTEERNLAKMNNMKNPTFSCQKDCDINYNTGIDLILSNYNEGDQVIVASHNLNSINFLNEKFKIMNKKPTDGKIIVAQLLGMGENASWLTIKHGFKTAKYVPYGDLNILLPYLIRRAEESSIITKIKNQNELINQELFIRSKINSLH